MEHLIPWFTLKSVPGIGNLLFRRLVDQLAAPERILSAPTAQLAQVKGITPRLAAAILRQTTPDWVRIELSRVANSGFKLITLHDPSYPELLRHIPDPPPLLYAYGSLEPAAAHIAMVGSRKATTYGLTSTRRLSRQLAERGMTVVSGMARGIDTAAHQGALEAGGQTVAVLGSGLKRIYPAENRQLFDQIGKHGAVLTEYRLDAEPEAHHFPQRNRVISGISLGTVVVEAAQRSGSLITARLAAEQGREVFAVPGSIHAPTARGTHALIQQGAKLVATADDVLDELQPQLAGFQTPVHGSATALPALSADETRVLEAIGPYPLHIDELARQLQHDMGRLSATLMQLELKGVICQEPGRYFLRQADFTERPQFKK
jgi:DNA processing protein